MLISSPETTEKKDLMNEIVSYRSKTRTPYICKRISKLHLCNGFHKWFKLFAKEYLQSISFWKKIKNTYNRKEKISCLGNICSVKAINTVGSYDSKLFHNFLATWIRLKIPNIHNNRWKKKLIDYSLIWSQMVHMPTNP